MSQPFDIHDFVRASRERQGLPTRVDDPTTLAKLAVALTTPRSCLHSEQGTIMKAMPPAGDAGHDSRRLTGTDARDIADNATHLAPVNVLGSS